jgi:ankyrin repeat protein
MLLYRAARHGDTATVTTLLSSAGAQSLINYQDAIGASPLHAAAVVGHAAITNQLIEARCSVDHQDKQGCTPLFFAAHHGHEAVTKQLIAARCNVDLQDKAGITPNQRGDPR